MNKHIFKPGEEVVIRDVRPAWKKDGYTSDMEKYAGQSGFIIDISGDGGIARVNACPKYVWSTAWLRPKQEPVIDDESPINLKIVEVVSDATK